GRGCPGTTGEQTRQRSGGKTEQAAAVHRCLPSNDRARARVGQTATQRPHLSHPASTRSLIGRCPRLQTTSQAVQSVQRLATPCPPTGDAPPSSEKSAPPGQSERQNPPREIVVSKSHTAASTVAPPPRPRPNASR